MTRSFRGGASLHTLITDAPVPALCSILSFLDLALDLPEGDEPVLRQSLLFTLGDLPADTARKLDDLAQRLLTLSRSRGADALQKVTGARLAPVALAALNEQPDALARAIHAWREHRSEFEDAESLQHAQHYRDFSPIFSAFDAPVAATFVWDETSERQLRERIVEDLKLEGPVRLSHLEVTEEGESDTSHVIIVRHGGPLSSIATHGKDGGKDWFYYRPSTEATLIYSPARGIVEVCAASPSVRQDVAVAFAEVSLKQDLSNKPLSFKLYNLSRFRESLTLPLQQPDGLRVESVGVVEVDVCLSDPLKRLTLKVPAADNIEAVAEQHLGSRRLLRQYPVVRLVVAVEYWPPAGRRTRTLKISLSEPNRCNLRGNPDPELRKLGYDLLEHWGVLQALRTLGPDDRRRLLPSLLALYDLGADILLEHELAQRGLDVAAFSSHGFLEPAGRLTSMLVDEDEGCPELVEVHPGLGGTGEFEDSRGGTAWQPKALVTKYRVDQAWVRETVLKQLLPMLPGRAVATPVPALHRLGEISLEDEAVVCYLARGLSDPRIVRSVEDHLRGGSTPGYGLILAAGEPGVGFLGSNVVLDVRSLLRGEAGGPAIDLEQLRLAYLAARQRARNGSTVELVKAGAGLATLHVPGKPPLTLTGENQIRMFDKLVTASLKGTLLVPTSSLIESTSCKTPKQAFSRWDEIIDVYLCSPRKGHWQLAT